MTQRHIHPEAGHQKNQALRYRDRLLVAGGIGPTDVDLLAAQVVPPELLHNRHSIRQNLERMINVALHIEHRNTAGSRDFPQILIAFAPIHMPDSNTVVVAPKDFAYLFGGVAVRNLGGAALDELGMSAELRHACLKAGAGARAAKKE